MSTVKKYLSLIKFSHTIFAMPFALIGFAIAIYRPFKVTYGTDKWNYNSWISIFAFKLFLVIMCMIFARSAAMAFNRYLDRHYDAKNPRTAVREIPAGEISPPNALIFTVVSCCLFMASAYFINSMCFLLSPVALAVVLGYS